MARATSGFPIMTTASVSTTSEGARSKWPGSSSIPTDTKKSTANASRIGSASEAARTLNSDRPTTIPAMNAPSAIETSNSVAEPTAIPSATTSTHSVKDLRHLLRKMLVGDEARRVGADEHSREQVADDWRETKPVREVSVGKRRCQNASP